MSLPNKPSRPQPCQFCHLTHTSLSLVQLEQAFNIYHPCPFCGKAMNYRNSSCRVCGPRDSFGFPLALLLGTDERAREGSGGSGGAIGQVRASSSGEEYEEIELQPMAPARGKGKQRIPPPRPSHPEPHHSLLRHPPFPPLAPVPLPAQSIPTYMPNTKCAHTDCPIKSPHSPGPYYHIPYRPNIWVPVFGFTDPPPDIWEAYDRIERKEGKALDVLAVRGFLRAHGDGERFEFGDD